MYLPKWLLVVILVCGLAVSSVSGSATTGEQVNSAFTYPYSGWLADPTGQPAPDGV